MSEILIEILKNLGWNLKDVIGQVYVNGANIRGHKAGVQSRIINLNSWAFYVVWSRHFLNHMINEVATPSI